MPKHPQTQQYTNRVYLLGCMIIFETSMLILSLIGPGRYVYNLEFVISKLEHRYRRQISWEFLVKLPSNECYRRLVNMSSRERSQCWPRSLSPYGVIMAQCVNHLTLNVRGPSCLGLTRSISWLLMPWLLTSPGHQHPWYWLDYVVSVGSCLIWGRISTTCVASMWRNDTKCK